MKIDPDAVTFAMQKAALPLISADENGVIIYSRKLTDAELIEHNRILSTPDLPKPEPVSVRLEKLEAGFSALDQVSKLTSEESVPR